MYHDDFRLQFSELASFKVFLRNLKKETFIETRNLKSVRFVDVGRVPIKSELLDLGIRVDTEKHTGLYISIKNMDDLIPVGESAFSDLKRVLGIHGTALDVMTKNDLRIILNKCITQNATVYMMTSCEKLRGVSLKPLKHYYDTMIEAMADPDLVGRIFLMGEYRHGEAKMVFNNASLVIKPEGYYLKGEKNEIFKGRRSQKYLIPGTAR